MLHYHVEKRDAYRTYLVLEGAASLLFGLIFTVSMIYQVTVVHLNPLQLVLVGTVLELTVFVFEVPTGVVADIYSRRLSILIGLVLLGIGFVVLGLVPTFAMVLVAQVFYGLGATFTSGATEAWIADEIGEEAAAQAFMRGAQVGQLGGLAGIALSAVLGSVTLQLPIVLGGVLFVVLAGWLTLVMPENGFNPVPAAERSTWRSLAHTLGEGVRLVRGRRILITFLAIAAVLGLYSEGFDRLWAAHLITNFALPTTGILTTVVWFALLDMLSMGLSIGAVELARRRVDMTAAQPIARALMLTNGLTVAGIIVFALAGHTALAVGSLLLVRVMRRVTGPLLSGWLNQHVDSSVRATVFSLSAQVDAIGQIAGGPGVGYIGKVVSLRAALALSGLMLSPVLALLPQGSRQGKQRESGVPVLANTD